VRGPLAEIRSQANLDGTAGHQVELMIAVPAEAGPRPMRRSDRAQQRTGHIAGAHRMSLAQLINRLTPCGFAADSRVFITGSPALGARVDVGGFRARRRCLMPELPIRPCLTCNAPVVRARDIDTDEVLVVDADQVDDGHVSLYALKGHAFARRYGQPARLQPRGGAHLRRQPAAPTPDPYEDASPAEQQHGGWRE
jgi:hypothetical protein